MERYYWVAWSQIKGIGPVLLKRVWQHFGSLEAAWRSPRLALGEVEGLGGKLVDKVVAGRSPVNPQQVYEQHLAKNPQFWTPSDPDYPKLLLEIPSPPPVLYYRGQVNALENQGKIPAIAIVGTRHPTEHGKRWTARMSKALSQAGFTIVSGMAKGIDGIAHNACLKVPGRTIAVLGTGVDVVYPANHRQLYEEINAKGLILSEYPAGTKPDRSNFPARNRIIAGLSRATLVMEAPTRSGSLITARYANEFNRDVYTLPNSPEQQQASGCLDLIRRGASMLLNEKRLLEDLGSLPHLDEVSPQLSLLPTDVIPEPVSEPEPEPIPQKLDFTQIPRDLLPLWHAISPEATPFDLIVVQSGLKADRVSATLLEWELEGLISQLPGMRYRRL
ncbi:DNA protecting protein DprA [[Leptolyngbya] sp. PCC 7376]|nr:DNA protecting protein DprA [[Leptolyngbya] sp. PCC 7376]